MNCCSKMFIKQYTILGRAVTHGKSVNLANIAYGSHIIWFKSLSPGGCSFDNKCVIFKCVVLITFTPNDIEWRCTSLSMIYHKSKLAHVMAWCRQQLVRQQAITRAYVDPTLYRHLRHHVTVSFNKKNRAIISLACSRIIHFLFNSL